MDEQTLRERLKAAVFGLSIACPYHQGNPDSCQLCQISPVRESRHERDAICLSWLQVEMPERIGASYDGSYNTSPECWEIFTEILGKEFGDAVLFGQVHQLTVDTYAAQHAGGGHRDKSVIIHLGGLHLVLDRGLRPTAVPRLFQRLSAVVRVWPHLLPPADMSAITVFDVALAESTQHHARLVREWAMFVWRAWSPNHQQIRDFVVEHLYPKEQKDHKTASASQIAPHNPPPRVLPPALLPSSRRRAAP